MEFKVFQKELELQSRGWIPTFHDVTKEIGNIVAMSGVKNGTVCVASHHTTCSVMVQETSHDIDKWGIEYLQHDLLDIMKKLVPSFDEEHQYRHPGPVHTNYGRYVNEPGDYTSLTTDGHLRSCFFGRSETMTIKDGVLDGGEFAHVYFIDWELRAPSGARPCPSCCPPRAISGPPASAMKRAASSTGAVLPARDG